MSNYLEELSPVQYQAVTHVDGPVMIIAGAGSGKTRVLTYRIAYLMSRGVPPFNILALTFTNKAAKEMRHRIEAIVGTNARSLWMGTFHSIFSKILRLEANKLGYPSNFTIYDTDDSKSLIKTILKESNLAAEFYKPSAVYSRISLAKNNFISPAQYVNKSDWMEEDMRAGRANLWSIYDQYIKRCHKAGAMDFDDLLLNTYKLFAEHPDVLNKYQHKFAYAMVDEYQDTNQLQYLIIKKLAAVRQNICVVGDDAQSIYGFRGADIQNILNFEKDYPDAVTYKLEQNYRSTKNIVAAASDIIAKNKHQLPKQIWTSNLDGEKLIVNRSLTDNEEGNWVANSIFQEKMEKKSFNKDFVILYRTNSQSRSFEESLRRLNIPYRIVGGVSFYQRKEVKDLVAYLRLSVNPADEEAFKRIINYPARGIGDTTLLKISNLANQNNVSLWSIVANIDFAPLEPRVKKAVSGFAEMIKHFQALAISQTNIYDIVEEIVKKSGLNKALYEDKSIEGMSRYENIVEFLGAVKEFSQEEDIVDKSLGAFLNDISLMTDSDKDDGSEDKITMMTIHGAKGLEFDNVYIVGLEENLFPSNMSMSSLADLEEERRLFYVALTRARKRAFLTYATQRFRFGQMVFSEPSRFLNEINPAFLSFDENESTVHRGFNTSVVRGAFPTPSNNQPKPLVNTAEENAFEGDDLSNIKVGDKVMHSRFGKGIVETLEGRYPETKILIEFENFGSKTIVGRFAKIKILNG